MRPRPALAALVTLLLASSGCQVPRFEGPEIQSPPPNFQRQPDTHSDRPTFPDRPVTLHRGWVHTDLGGVSLIFVDEHPGVVELDDVLAAHDALQRTERDPDAVYGGIESMTIDGREAWGWHERVESPRRGLEDVRFRAVVPYDSVTYALEFSSSEPTLKAAAPDTLRAVLSSFGIGRVTYNIPLIVIVAGGLLFVVSMARSRSRAKADRLRSINLVSIKKDDEEEEKEEAAGAAAGSSPGATPTSGVSGGSPGS